MNQPNVDWKDLSVEGARVLSVSPPPQANWKIYFCGKQLNNTYFQFYVEHPPNRFQRWMMGKVLGIYWEKV